MTKRLIALLLLLSTVLLLWLLKKPKVYAPEPMPIDVTLLNKSEEASTSRKQAALPDRAELVMEGLVQSVQKDDLCKVIENIPDGDYTKLLQIFSKLHLLSRDWEESIGPDSPLLGRDKPHYDSEAAQFFSALLLSNQFIGVSAPKENWKKARSLLTELSEAHPDNAAYAFFLLPIAEKLKSPEADLVALVKQIAGASSFNTHMAELSRAVHEAAWVNSSLNLLSQVILSTLPMPDTGSANISFMKVSRANHLLVEVHAFALLLMKQGLESPVSYTQMGYIPIEYSLGRQLLARGEPSIDPNSYPKYTELAVEKNYRQKNPEDSPILDIDGCKGENTFRAWFTDAKSANRN